MPMPMEEAAVFAVPADNHEADRSGARQCLFDQLPAGRSPGREIGGKRRRSGP